jgi:hypothetical protein
MNLLFRGGYRSIRQGLLELAYDIKGILALGGVQLAGAITEWLLGSPDLSSGYRRHLALEDERWWHCLPRPQPLHLLALILPSAHQSPVQVGGCAKRFPAPIWR